MNIVSKEDIKRLIAQTSEPCVSIYMPTHRTGQEVRQDPIRFKNLLKTAENQMKEHGFKDTEIKQLLNPALGLLEDIFFWNHQSDGLAVFSSSDKFIHYRVPYEFKESVVVGHSFHLKQILPLISNNGQFYVLALDKSNLKLYQVTRFKISETNPDGVPKSLDEAQRYDDFERQFQLHSQGSPSQIGQRQPMFHGHGQGTDEAQDKRHLLQYFYLVNKGVTRYLKEQNIPLLLAGVEYLLPLYREANSYPFLVEEELRKDPQAMDTAELQKCAWEVMEPIFTREQEEARARFHDSLGTGKSSKNINEIISAAYNGRVESLFVARDQHRWGYFDPNTHEVKFYDNKEIGHTDLLDFAVIYTLLRDGSVYAVKTEEMPVDSPLAALFRY